MMENKMSGLSPEEFKKKFPIILKKYDSNYKDWYEIEKQNIVSVVKAEDNVRINHIGSSAVEGLIAKPTIDILLEVDGCCNITKLIEKLNTIDFGNEVFIHSDNPFKLLLGKGYSSNGYEERVFHLHVRYFGDWDELYFRDYLLLHPTVAAEYGELKIQILKDIEAGILERMPNGQPNGYSKAKEIFVSKYTEAAKREFQGKYKPRSMSQSPWNLNSTKMVGLG